MYILTRTNLVGSYVKRHHIFEFPRHFRDDEFLPQRASLAHHVIHFRHSNPTTGESQTP